MSKSGEETMTVEQVIEELKKLDPKLPVVTEGCDCDGNVKSVSVQDYNFRGIDKVAYLGRDRV